MNPSIQVLDVSRPHLLLHEGGFEGFLSCLHEALELRLVDVRIESRDLAQPGLFEEVREIATDGLAAARARQGILARGGSEILSMVRSAILSEQNGIQSAVFRYLRRAWESQAGSVRNVLDPDMIATLGAAERTLHEAHRFQGFVRFCKAPEGLLFSVIAPDHNILELIGPHFLSRFPNEDWMIVDSRRRLCLRPEGEDFSVSKLLGSRIPLDEAGCASMADPAEELVRDRWLAYYRSINIPERANPRLMQRNLPRKYWRYLIERSNSGSSGSFAPRRNL